MAKFTTTGNTTYDLTDNTVNAIAVEPATPREGGFVLRNRINFANVTAPTATSRVANVLRILKIPKGTVIRELRFHAVRGTTAPTHAFSSASSLSASDGSGATLNVGTVTYMSTSQSASSASTDTDALADHAITKKTGVAAGMPTLSSSTALTDYTSQSDSGSPTLPFTFPFGGWIQMGIANSTGSSASSVSAKMAGTLEIRAVCDYLGE